MESVTDKLSTTNEQGEKIRKREIIMPGITNAKNPKDIKKPTTIESTKISKKRDDIFE